MLYGFSGIMIYGTSLPSHVEFVVDMAQKNKLVLEITALPKIRTPRANINIFPKNIETTFAII